MRRFEQTPENDTHVVIDRGSGVGTFLLGIGIGAGLALLFAPQSGKDLRRTIRRGARNMRNHTRDMAEQLSDSVAETFTNVRDQVEQRVNRHV